MYVVSPFVVQPLYTAVITAIVSRVRAFSCWQHILLSIVCMFLPGLGYVLLFVRTDYDWYSNCSFLYGRLY